MAVEINLQAVKSVVAGPKYAVVCTITSAVGIPMECFVYDAHEDVYSRVAAVDDMVMLGTGFSNVDYYRRSNATMRFDSISAAIEAVNVVHERLKKLAVDYDKTVNVFVGTTTSVITS